ncbi:hypothetical protein [Methylobacterium nigriterrae]|uniref:hypothetical protein n=1 Tax=Methylobacterium nigriterrae TaxID=3127512 RepID=UPI003013A6FB
MPDKPANPDDLAETTYDADQAAESGDQIVIAEQQAGASPSNEPVTNEPIAIETEDADVGLSSKGAEAGQIPGKRETDF